MRAALIKIDGVAERLGRGVRAVEAMVDGGDLVDGGLVWVFDLAKTDTRRELRFWLREVEARASDRGQFHKLANWELDWVLAQILPPSKKFFQAGEVDHLFQIRHNTRLEFGAELNGNLTNGANTYARANLVAFLTRRWLGAVYDRKTI